MCGTSLLPLGSAVVLAILLIAVTLGSIGALVMTVKALIQLQTESLQALKVLIADTSQARMRQDSNLSAIQTELLASRLFSETHDLQATAGILGHHAHHEQYNPGGQPPPPSQVMVPMPQVEQGGHVGEDFTMPGEDQLRQPPQDEG